MYSLSFARVARKELERLRDPILGRVLRRIESLSTNPRPLGCRKLAGADDLWRIRVGDYRVIYSIDDIRRHLDVNAVRHRSEVYR